MLPADNKIILTGELGKPASKCCPGPQANSHQSVDAQQHLELELLSPIPSVPSLSFPPLAAEMNTKLPSLGDFPGDYSFPLQFPMAQPGSYPPLGIKLYTWCTAALAGLSIISILCHLLSGLSDEQQTPARIVHSAILHNGPTVVTVLWLNSTSPIFLRFEIEFLFNKLCFRNVNYAYLLGSSPPPPSQDSQSVSLSLIRSLFSSARSPSHYVSA